MLSARLTCCRMEVETDVGRGGGEQINESAATATSRSTAELSDADIIGERGVVECNSTNKYVPL